MNNHQCKQCVILMLNNKSHFQELTAARREKNISSNKFYSKRESYNSFWVCKYTYLLLTLIQNSHQNSKNIN